MTDPRIKLIKHSEFYNEIQYTDENQSNHLHIVSRYDTSQHKSLVASITTLDGGLWTPRAGKDKNESKIIFDNFVNFVISNLKASPEK